MFFFVNEGYLTKQRKRLTRFGANESLLVTRTIPLLLRFLILLCNIKFVIIFAFFDILATLAKKKPRVLLPALAA